MEIYLNKLPDDILRKIANVKIKEINDIKDMFKDAVQKNWYKYCKCLSCTARRARILHFVDGYNEAF